MWVGSNARGGCEGEDAGWATGRAVSERMEDAKERKEG